MLKILPLTLLTACLALTSCSNGGGGSLQTAADGPQAPINDPDTGIFDPQGPDEGGAAPNTNENPVPGNGGGSGSSGGGSNGGSSLPDPNGGGQNPSGNELDPNGGSNGSSGSGAGGSPGQEPEGSGNGSQPVPEPSTLLLVGSGLAGVGASLLRRRRKQAPQA